MITIISGTNRSQSRSLLVSKEIKRLLENISGRKVSILDLSEIPPEVYHSDMYDLAKVSPAFELIKEKYQGIRPAPGYPACPDHTEKGLLWKLLEVEKNADIQLTESYAMQPGAAVSGFYFAHPQSKYFGLGKINKDQLVDYAKNKQYETAVMEKWLRPNLGY